MEISYIKNFLKIDFDDDDDYIKLLKEVAIEYIEDSIGSFNPERAKQKYLLLTLIKEMYSKRSFIIDKSDEKIRYISKSIILQEQLE